jgi:plastocyanin
MTIWKAPALIALTLVASCLLGTHFFTINLSAAGQLQRFVTMKDACDPETFGSLCARDTGGGVTFDNFIAELMQRGEAGGWFFAPPHMTAKLGDTLVAINRGGEVHTFTEVEEFGGGFVTQLNDILGLTELSECAISNLEPDDFVPPDGRYEEPITETGTLKFQCCIHPWMRTEVRVR